MQVALILRSMVATLVILKNGHSRNDIVDARKNALSSIGSPIFILLSIGALIGAWNMSGTRRFCNRKPCYVVSTIRRRLGSARVCQSHLEWCSRMAFRRIRVSRSWTSCFHAAAWVAY